MLSRSWILSNLICSHALALLDFTFLDVESCSSKILYTFQLQFIDLVCPLKSRDRIVLCVDKVTNLFRSPPLCIKFVGIHKKVEWKL